MEAEVQQRRGNSGSGAEDAYSSCSCEGKQLVLLISIISCEEDLMITSKAARGYP